MFIVLRECGSQQEVREVLESLDQKIRPLNVPGLPDFLDAVGSLNGFGGIPSLQEGWQILSGGEMPELPPPVSTP